MSVYVDLQRATAVLNAETEDQSRDEEDRIQNDAENADAQLALRAPDSRSDAAENAINIRLSGNPDLGRLTAAQIHRLEQGFSASRHRRPTHTSELRQPGSALCRTCEVIAPARKQPC